MKRAMCAAAALAAAWAAVLLGAGATRSAKDKVLLTQRYVPGEYVQTLKMTMDQTIQVGEQEIPQKMTMQFAIRLRIGEPEQDGSKKMTLTYERIKQDVEMLGRKMSYDSAGEGPQDPNLGRGLGPLLKAKVSMTIGPDGKVKDVAGMDAMWDALAAKDPSMARMTAQMKRGMGDEKIKEMVEKFGDYLPDKPVAVGETWDARAEMEIPVVGAMNMVTTCKLKDIQHKPSGRHAVIDVTAQAKSEGGQIPGAAQAKVRGVALDMVGRQTVNVANPMLFTSTLTQKGTMVMEFGGPAGGANAPTTAKSTFTMNMTMTCEKAPPAPASRPAGGGGG